MTCPTCNDSNVGEISFTFHGGLRFFYCRRCEYRWWTGRSNDMRLDDVLQAATSLARAS